MNHQPWKYQSVDQSRCLHGERNGCHSGKSPQSNDDANKRPGQCLDTKTPPAHTAHQGHQEINQQARRDVLGNLEDAVTTIAEQKRHCAHGATGDRGTGPGSSHESSHDIERNQDYTFVAGRKGQAG